MNATNTSTQRVPTILQIGLGRFGQQHFETWKRLEAEGLAQLAGVLISKRRLETENTFYKGVPLFTTIPPELLKKLDGVDIVTPSETHYRLAREFLPHTNVLIEKPLAESAMDAGRLQEEAQDHNRVLMVNHLYRFHPAILKLKELMAARHDRLRMVTGVMVNPADSRWRGEQAPLELLHHFDILDEIFGPGSVVVNTSVSGDVRHIDLQCPGGVAAEITIGWSGEERIRTLEVEYTDLRWVLDLQDTTIREYTAHSFDRIHGEPAPRLLEAALRAFLEAIQGKGNRYPDAAVGHRVLDVALACRPKRNAARPKVAVIGGGIFGASCAIELAPHCDVTLFERHDELLTEATFLNQWRYHSGFHYPRSTETVQEIQATREDFESCYREAILYDVISYYCTASSAKEITRERYLKFCGANQLRFMIENPPEGILDPAQVSLSLRTDEGVFDFPKLRTMVKAKLAAFREIRVQLGSEAIGGRIEPDGAKILTIQSNGKEVQETFDYVVNTTYTNLNLFAKWFHFPIKRLRFDLCEMLLLEIDMPSVSVTILDGPFTSLVSTGRDNLFLLSQMNESVLRSAVPHDGMPPDWEPFLSNRLNMMKQCRRYLPVLDTARLVESRFATRAVRAFSEDFDGRPTVVTAHGFGCWSVLGGKIATCVSNARSVLHQMLPGTRSEEQLIEF